MSHRAALVEGTAVLHGMLLMVVLGLGIGLRFWLCVVWGQNQDMAAWRDVAKVMHLFGSPYSYPNYNYAPVWAWLLWLLSWLPWDLHLSVVGVLTAADFAIACMLLNWVGPLAAVLFWLNPVSIIITGFHSQFDCLAIAVGMAGVGLLRK